MCCNALVGAQLPGAAALQKERKLAVDALMELQGGLATMLKPTESPLPATRVAGWEAIVNRDPTSIYARLELCEGRLTEGGVRRVVQPEPPAPLSRDR